MLEGAPTGLGARSGETAIAALDRPRRLLVCSPDFPHPSRGASMVVLYHYVTCFRRMGFEILHVIPVLERKGLAEDEAEYRRVMGVTGADANFRILVHPMKSHYLERARKDAFKPVRVSFSPAEIAAMAGDFRPDAIFGFDLLGAALVQAIPGPKVVWLGDLNFETKWYHAWYACKEHPRHILGLPLAWANARAWRQSYRDTLKGVDSVIVCAKHSERAMAAIGIPSTYLPFPWPSEKGRTEGTDPQIPAKPTFLFLGNLVGLGSRSALHFLLGPLYASLIKQWGKEGFEILICGTHGLPPWVDALVKPKAEIVYLGFVEDLESLMQRCHGVIAPIDVPVGNRTRILTAMAARVPVIAHGNTALGNPDLVDGETCFLADDAETFGSKMRRVHEDRDMSRAMAEKAFASYRASFDPEKASAQMGQILVEALRESSRRV